MVKEKTKEGFIAEKRGEEDKTYAFLLDKIRRNRNIDFFQYRQELLKRRIDHRMRLSGCSDYWDYILLLNRDPAEYDRLIEVLTIKESYFFRDADVFDMLEGAIIPEIVFQKESRRAKKINVWSCGAAFGEEAYSVAILLNEVLGGRINDFDISITATDISKEALEKAPWGSYDKHVLGRMKPYMLFKYFTPAGNRYVVSDKPRLLVTFRQHDIASGGPLADMDLVLCRNLLIYFEKEFQEKVLYDLHAALNPGGFLVLGKVENIPSQMSGNFEAVDLISKIYRRK